MIPLRCFIGYDSQEPIAYHVLAHSILRRATVPISVTPVALSQICDVYKRVRTPLESTEFSISRFLVPYLSGYEGYSIFMDCDMLCLVDLKELAADTFGGRGADKAVYVVQHAYTPHSSIKFLGQLQVPYPRKNWSSLMVFDNTRCRALVPQYVNQASGLELHRFQWLQDDEIGSLRPHWNWLAGYYDEASERTTPKIIHYTDGGPWHIGYENCPYADLWRAERDALCGS